MLFFEHVKRQSLDTFLLTNYCSNVFSNPFPMRDLGVGLKDENMMMKI